MSQPIEGSVTLFTQGAVTYTGTVSSTDSSVTVVFPKPYAPRRTIHRIFPLSGVIAFRDGDEGWVIVTERTETRSFTVADIHADVTVEDDIMTILDSKGNQNIVILSDSVKAEVAGEIISDAVKKESAGKKEPVEEVSEEEAEEESVEESVEEISEDSGEDSGEDSSEDSSANKKKKKPGKVKKVKKVKKSKKEDEWED